MTERKLQLACCLTLGVSLAGAIAVARWLDPPPPAPSFDVMLDSASQGLKTHPCATDPSRACFTMQITQP